MKSTSKSIRKSLSTWYSWSQARDMTAAYYAAGQLSDSDVAALARLGQDRGRALRLRYPHDGAYKSALADIRIRSRLMGVQVES